MLKLLRKNEGLGGQWCWGTALVGKFRTWSGLQYGDPKTFNMLRKMKDSVVSWGRGGNAGSQMLRLVWRSVWKTKKPETHKGNEGLSDPTTQHSPIAD